MIWRAPYADADVRGPVLALLRLNLVVSLAPSANSEWTVGLAAWIIQDGNYDDFAVGDHAEFALQCCPEGLAPVRAGTKHQAMQVDEDLYQITATVVHVGDHGWVLDFGLLAYGDTAPSEGVAAGQVLTGRTALGVDPFSYFEQLAKDPRYPDMVYTWNVRSIGRETAPFVPRGNGWVRDERLRGRADVPATNAWTDDDGHADTYSAVNCCPCPPSVRVPPPGRTTQAEDTAACPPSGDARHSSAS